MTEAGLSVMKWRSWWVVLERLLVTVLVQLLGTELGLR